jgi:type I restriction enzyme S subunit
MNKKEKMALVPKFRFPEFIDCDKWKNAKIKTLFSNRQESGFVELPLMSLTDEFGIIPQSNSNKRDNSNSDKSKYLRICRGDIVYNTMRMWQGRCAYSDVEGIVSPAYTVCIPEKNNVGLFFYYYFKTDTLIKKFHANSQGLVSDTLNLKYDAFSNIEVAYPNQEEQQKIAECLSSLDDLITAEDKKLSALKDHKKGLMQKLFPAEGKIVSDWRFPEFIDGKGWSLYSLSNICVNLDSKRIPITEKERKSGFTPYYGASGIVDYIDGFIFDEYLLCVSEDGANLVARTYPIAFSISGKTWVNNHAHVLKFEDSFTQILVENYLNHIDLSDFLTGMAQPKLNRAKLDSIPIPLPEKREQQKIADFLSSVNELISAQDEKIEALKEHKKGLMQGLFPSIEEVSQ